MCFLTNKLSDSKANLVWSWKFYDMFAFALTYKSCECQLAAADQEALPTKNKPLSFSLRLQKNED